MYTFYCYLPESMAERKYDIEADTFDTAKQKLKELIHDEPFEIIQTGGAENGNLQDS